MYHIIQIGERNMEKIKQDLNIGRNIQRIRKSRKMSQKDVTIQMNLRGRMISVSGYAHIEQGRQNLYVSDLIMLKEILDVPYEAFFEGLLPDKE